MHAFDKELVELERKQHGLAALHQLDETWKAGIIRRRVVERRKRAAPRVYGNPSVPETYEQRVCAAVLSAGRDAFASHETAARLWGLPLSWPATLEITTSDARRPLVAGTRMHRTSYIDPHDRTVLEGIPLTTCAMTIYSLSSRIPAVALGRMIDDAVRRKVLHLDDLVEVVERVRPANGRSRRKMRIVLGRRLPGVEDRESMLEDFVVAAILRFALPPPIAQHPVVFEGQPRRIDLCYVDEWLALEAKGFRWYKARTEFDRDALRGNELQLTGFRVLTFTPAFTDLQIARQVAVALGLPSPAARPALTFGAWSRRH